MDDTPAPACELLTAWSRWNVCPWAPAPRSVGTGEGPSR